MKEYWESSKLILKGLAVYLLVTVPSSLMGWEVNEQVVIFIALLFALQEIYNRPTTDVRHYKLEMG